MKKLILRYIKNISENTNSLLQALGIMVIHKPTKSIHSILCKAKDSKATEDKTGGINNIQCKDRENHYVGQTERRLTEYIHEAQLTVKRHDENS